MGFMVDGTHDEKLAEKDWILIEENPPQNYTNVYLLCKFMMDCFVVIGQIADGKRIKFDDDPDAFFKSTILYWKPLENE